MSTVNFPCRLFLSLYDKANHGTIKRTGSVQGNGSTKALPKLAVQLWFQVFLKREIQNRAMFEFIASGTETTILLTMKEWP